jgi:protein tyrosine kinase modulator
MALSAITPRDRLQRLVDLARKTLRYWWLMALFAIVGGALSFAFAVSRPRKYVSTATLSYEELIQKSVLSPNHNDSVERNIGDRFRELLMAHSQLEQIVGDAKLNPFPDEGADLGVEKLRQAIRFETRGTTFKVMFTDTEPARAQAVTAKLVTLLQDKDESLRKQQAQATVTFAVKQQEEAATELHTREQALAEFLAKHPEFVQDPNQPSEGASIRAVRNANKTPTGNTRLYTLERQRQRIQARLDAREDQPQVRIPTPPSPERLAAEAAVQDAQRELASAQRELDDALSKYTKIHPTVIKAQEKVDSATQKLRHAQATVPPEEAPIKPASPEDRVKLQKELAQLDEEIAAEQKTGKPDTSSDKATNWIVELETEHAKLRRAVTEQRGKVESLSDSVFRATLNVNEKLAETGGPLLVIDPADKPVQPTGPGKTILLMAGMVLFMALGLTLAVGLAVIDDRLYRRSDLDQLGIAVLGVIPPARKVTRKRRETA